MTRFNSLLKVGRIEGKTIKSRSGGIHISLGAIFFFLFFLLIFFLIRHRIHESMNTCGRAGNHGVPGVFLIDLCIHWCSPPLVMSLVISERGEARDMLTLVGKNSTDRSMLENNYFFNPLKR